MASLNMMGSGAPEKGRVCLGLRCLLGFMLILAVLFGSIVLLRAEAVQTNYLSGDQVYQEFLNLEFQFPGIIDHAVYDNATVRMKSLYVFRIGNSSGARVMFSGGAHGNEKVSPEVLLRYAQWLLNGTDLDAQRILNECWTLIVPIVNLDMYGATRKNADGVDLNRNFDWDWGLRDASTDPSSWKYAGPSPESEPEDRTMRLIWADYLPKQYLDCHSGGNGFWYSGYTNTTYANSVYSKYKVEAASRNQTFFSPISRCQGSGCFDCTPQNKSDLKIFGWSVELNYLLTPAFSQIEPSFQAALPLFITLSDETAGPSSQTGVFSDGFEGGNLYAWSGTYTTANDNVTVSTAQKFQGSYAAAFSVTNATTSMRNAQLREYVDQTNLLYVRGYFYIDYGLAGFLDQNDRLGLIVVSSPIRDKASFQVRRINDQNCFAIGYLSGTREYVASTTTILPSEKTWYCVELAIYVNDTLGWEKAWVNGTQILSVSDINNTYCGDITQVFWGPYAINGGIANSMWAVQVFGDEAKIANSYIGPVTDGDQDGLFSDGFEEGNLYAWSGTYTTANDSVSVSTAQKFQGYYGTMFSVANATTSMRNAQLRELVDQTSLLYVRGYFYIDYGLTGFLDENDRFGLIVVSSPIRDKASFQVRRINNQNCFAITYLSGNNEYVASTREILPSEKTWYCVELAIYVNGTQGWEKAWVNGTQILSVSSIDNTYCGDITQVFWGTYVVNGGTANNMWAVQVFGDEAKIANSYIGPLNAG